MKERNGVRVGQRVRDVEGKDLGKVARLFDATFEVRKGFPILFADDRVLRYEDVRAREDRTLVVSRADGDVFTLAEGRLPDSWRLSASSPGTAQGFPSAATPSEASRLLGRGLAKGRR